MFSLCSLWSPRLSLAQNVSVLGIDRCSFEEQTSNVQSDGDADPSCYEIPNQNNFPSNLYTLPDPFTFLNGDTVDSSSSWSCRAAQLRALFQRYELGYKPPRPDILTSSASSNSLSITTGFSNRTISFSVSINYPTTGSPPYPAIISYGFTTVPVPAGAASIVLNNDQIAQQNSAASRGIGLFYDLYADMGSSEAGALMAWAWAVSRVIDALEDSPNANIDPTRIAVTGCSRNGKGAMVAGAFDNRVALTIPQESGAGGDACWRASRYLYVDQGIQVQTATEIVTENTWFSQSFNTFAATQNSIGNLPFDHHELAGLVAPRGLYSTGNVGYTWLGDWSSYECMVAANEIFTALGAEGNQGFSQDGPHNHCSFPSDQTQEIQRFYDRFLFGSNANPGLFRTNGAWSFDSSWTPWTTPNLG